MKQNIWLALLSLVDTLKVKGWRMVQRIQGSVSRSEAATQAVPAGTFPPSEDVARLALAAARAKRLELGKQAFGSLVDCLEVSPQGPPSRSGLDAVKRAQESIRARLKRLLAAIGFQAAAEGAESIRISSKDQFTPLMTQGLLQDIPVDRERATVFLEQLLRELQEFARTSRLIGEWGQLCRDKEGLIIINIPPLRREPADRPPAKVVGGLAQR